MRIEHRLGTRLAGGLTAGLAALLLAGCGGSDDAPAAAASSSAAPSSSAAASSESRTGTEVATAAADALEGAGSAHVAGTIGTDGAQTIDLQLQGADVLGSVTMDGQTIQLLTVGGVSYLQAGADFWTGSGVPADAAGQLDGQWVIVPPEGAEEFGALTLSGFADELRNPSDGAFEDEVRTEQLDGQDVLVARQANGSEVYVAAEEPQYPLKTTTTGADAESVTIDGFGEPVEITAPTDALDLSELGA
jgi:hypothetical protein